MALCTLLLAGCSWGDTTGSAAPVDTVDSELAGGGASLFDLSLELTDRHGRKRLLESFRGHTTLVSMFYADCPYACPTLISDVRRLEAKLNEETREEVRVLLGEFRPRPRYTARLQTLARERKLDQERWTLANASEESVRELAAALGFKYRRLDDGNYNHTSAIVLMRSDGAIAARTEGLSQPMDDLAARTTALADSDD